MTEEGSLLYETAGGHRLRIIAIPEVEMPHIQEWCPYCRLPYRNETGKWSSTQPIELECGHVFCVSCIEQRVDFEIDPALACRECHPSTAATSGNASCLDSGWDELFSHLEAVRNRQALRGNFSSRASGDLSGCFTNSELVRLNAQRDTDYSMHELKDALQKMDLQNGTSTTVDDVLGRVRSLNLSGKQ